MQVRGSVEQTLSSFTDLRYGFRFDEVIAGNDVMFATKCSFTARHIEAINEVIYGVSQVSGKLTTKKSEAIFEARQEVGFDRLEYLKPRISSRYYQEIKPSCSALVIQAYKWFGAKKAIALAACTSHRMLFCKLRVLNLVHAMRSI